MNIPFSYIIFLGATLLLFRPQYIEVLDVSGWAPDSIRMIILDLVNFIYSNIWTVFLALIIVFIFLVLLTELNIITKILPKKIYYKNKTEESLNPYSAIRRILHMLISLITTCWIYYFTFNILFNEHNFAQNFLLHSPVGVDNELLVSGYLTENNLGLMKVLFWLNIIVAMYFLVRSLF